MPRPVSRLALALAGAAALAACTDDVAGPAAAPARSGSAEPARFVILASAESLPGDLAARVAAAGGTIERAFPELGVAVAVAADPGFAARAEGIAGVESVTRDLALRWTEPDDEVALAEGPAVAGPRAAVASLGDDEPFYAFQWAHGAVQAPEAWNAGYTGRGVRVAVVDGGLYAEHADLSANVDRAASRSFVPGFAWNQDTGTFWHGTHVAGIVGAADNGRGVVGIAPGATLVGVKVLHAGLGAFDGIVAGIYYAATPREQGGAGADVINLSLGLAIDARAKEFKAEIRELAKAVDRATRYAGRQGVTVIAATGNDGRNADDYPGWIDIPASSTGVIGVTATAPLGWARGAVDFTRPASYSTHGKSLVDLAAPGGDSAYPGREACRVAFFSASCWVFDMYLSTSRGRAAAGEYTWSSGTSMAAPVAAGIAALVIEAAGGKATPAQVEAGLRRGALDLGKPGKDELYGHGFVNAYRSIR